MLHTFMKKEVTFTNSFRKAKAEKVNKIEGKEYTESEEGGQAYLKRHDETFSWVPTPAEVEVSSEVMEMFLTGLVSDTVRALVDNGAVPTQEDINLEAILKDYVTVTSDVRKYSKDFRANCATLFAAFLTAAGKKPSGIEVQRDLLAGGVNVNTANKYLDGLPAIKQNFSDFILADTTTPEQQALYSEYILDMVAKIDNILNPTEVINIEDLGL